MMLWHLIIQRLISHNFSRDLFLFTTHHNCENAKTILKKTPFFTTKIICLKKTSSHKELSVLYLTIFTRSSRKQCSFLFLNQHPQSTIHKMKNKNKLCIFLNVGFLFLVFIFLIMKNHLQNC